jgi:ureidoglycolate lyase
LNGIQEVGGSIPPGSTTSSVRARRYVIKIAIEALTPDAFAPYGQIIQKAGAHNYPINGGRCLRFHDLARVEALGADARATISIFHGEPSALPLTLTMVERHPLGSQAFMPLTSDPFLVIVCGDQDGVPLNPRAFMTAPGQGVNYNPNVWHGVLTPLTRAADFLVVDRVGEGSNLEEHEFAEGYVIG